MAILSSLLWGAVKGSQALRGREAGTRGRGANLAKRGPSGAERGVLPKAAGAYCTAHGSRSAGDAAAQRVVAGRQMTLDHRDLNRNRKADSNCAGSDLRRKDDRR